MHYEILQMLITAKRPSFESLFTVFGVLLQKKRTIPQYRSFGDPREIRTPDTLIRSQVLYPAELLGHIGRGRGTQTPNLRFWRPLLYQLRYAPIPTRKGLPLRD